MMTSGVNNCSQISGFQYVIAVNGEADRPCTVSSVWVCIAD